MDKTAKLYIAGHTGLFGSALYKEAKKREFRQVIVRRHEELDLTRQAEAEEFFRSERPDYVIMAAALVGGIGANRSHMADFCMENLLMTCNVLQTAHRIGVKKLLYLGSSCIYPRECTQPVKEKHILTGACEPTNEGYAIAKIAGIRLCEYYKRQYGDPFISCIPANVYGPHDRFDEERAHVIPSLIMKFHKAKTEKLPEVMVWGSGNAEREFLYIDTAARICMELFEIYDKSEAINIGTGQTTSIKELAELIAEVVGYKGNIIYDQSRPDGMKKRRMDHSKLKELGIIAEDDLKEGLQKTYEWYLNQKYE